MTLELADRITTIILGVLGSKATARRTALLNSVLTLAGHSFDYTTTRTFIRRVASSLDCLERGISVNAGVVSTFTEGWYVLYVRDVIKSGSYYKLVLNIDYGPLTDVGFEWVLKEGDIQFLNLWRRLKLDKNYQGQWVYLTQMRFWGWVRLFNGVVTVNGIRGDNTIKSINSQIATYRRPPCPRRYNNPCVICPVGYEDCPAGCHQFTRIKVKGHDTDEDPTRGSNAGDARQASVDEPTA